MNAQVAGEAGDGARGARSGVGERMQQQKLLPVARPRRCGSRGGEEEVERGAPGRSDRRGDGAGRWRGLAAVEVKVGPGDGWPRRRGLVGAGRCIKAGRQGQEAERGEAEKVRRRGRARGLCSSLSL